MLIIPAIDLKEGRCVRLFQGQFDRETVYGDNPAEMARKWADLGAEWIHLVDLDGSLAKKPLNRQAIEAIRAEVDVKLELGGGIRGMDAISDYFEMGLDRLILGTLALRNPDLVGKAAREYPGRIAVGIDARGENVVVEGWTESSNVNYLELAKRYEGMGVAAIIYTDVERDGAGTGPNLERTRQLAKAVGIPIIASGGVKDIHDIHALTPLEKDGVAGVITGRALYEGDLDFAQAAAAGQSKAPPLL